MDEIYIFKLFNKNYSKSEPNQNIFLLRVDDNSLKKYGWPIPRGVYAVVLEALNLMGAKAVGFDILFLDSHNKEQDQQFIQAINNSKIPVFLGSELEISLTGHNVLNKAGGIKKPFMKLDKNSLAQYGHLNLILSNTGTPWFIDHHVHIEEEGVSPSLSFLMAQVLNPSLTAKRLPRPIFTKGSPKILSR